MNALPEIRKILAEMMYIDDEETITPETYVVRDLHLESIDFLELSVSLQARFGVRVVDEQAFLLRLREHLGSAPAVITSHYPQLTAARLHEIHADLNDGPTLKVKDLVAYVEHLRSLCLVG